MGRLPGFLLAVSAGVLAQAARVSLQAASRRAPTGRFLTAGDGVAALVAAGATALAVLAAG
ncbi:hypothetical protein [Actinacidiphila oryziradicis]|uniref:Uncharacterized protein n=1 Tax=Actinacidiphila oryziradicis TaxID=2571141 RepID=A0A4U0RCX5_9ACTN|nr:hypothetical protein [Actinacidiphila oryziradicis]TJZ93179.1 hypothetical protein FCI23_54660 [Actinacidiphila oryziradicis]